MATVSKHYEYAFVITGFTPTGATPDYILEGNYGMSYGGEGMGVTLYDSATLDSQLTIQATGDAVGVETKDEPANVIEDFHLKNGDPTKVSASDKLYAAQYTGYTIGGDPIVYLTGDSTYVLLTNTDSPTGEATETSTFMYCFAAGTPIATPQGERAVQALAIGDEVLTHDGRRVAVKWIGRQTRHPLFAKLNGNLPVRIGAGALGGGLPLRDLFVSPDHALLVDGCLVHASALVNGRTIVQVSDWQGDVEYFHVETENHELILAAGAPAETFVDNVSREKFDNHAEFAALYPDAAPMQELDLPRVKFERQLPQAIKRRLAAVADALQAREARAA